MASAYPVAAFILFAIVGAITLPLAWWLMAYWQHKRNLNRLSRASRCWSAMPILSFAILYLCAEKALVPPMATLIAFFLTPVVNIIALVVATFLTVSQSQKVSA